MSLFELTWQYLTTAASWTGSGGLLDRLAEQLLLTVTALLMGLLIGLPVALWLGHIGRGGFLAINISNIGRAVPTFALLAVLVTADWPGPAQLGPYGRAGLATLIALALFALPPLVTTTYTAIREVPDDVLEAADGMGMSGVQRFWRVELPLALPLMMSGVRLALVQVWATATIAALVAGPGVGAIIVSGFARNHYSEGIGAALVVAAVALVLEVAAAGAQKLVEPTRERAVPAKVRAVVGDSPRVSGGAQQRQAGSPPTGHARRPPRDTEGRHP